MITFKSTEDLNKLSPDDPAYATVKELVDQLITAYTTPGQPYDHESDGYTLLISEGDVDRTTGCVNTCSSTPRLSDELEAYAQSKLAITAWSRVMALSSKGDSQAIIAVNPGSLLGTKMMKEGFGMAGSDIRIGAVMLIRAVLSDEFATASGKYFDNDSGRFASHHPDAMDPEKSEGIMHAIEAVLAETLESYKKSP